MQKIRLSAFKMGAVFLDSKLPQDVVLEFNKNSSAQCLNKRQRKTTILSC